MVEEIKVVGAVEVKKFLDELATIILGVAGDKIGKCRQFLHMCMICDTPEDCDGCDGCSERFETGCNNCSGNLRHSDLEAEIRGYIEYGRSVYLP